MNRADIDSQDRSPSRSSAASAANAAIDHVRTWMDGTPEGDWVSMAIPSDGSYGTPEGLLSSFPCTTADGEWSIVQDLEIDDFSRTRIGALNKLDLAIVNADIAEMRAEGEQMLSAEGFAPEAQEFAATINLRYEGQEHSVTLPIEGHVDAAEVDHELPADEHPDVVVADEVEDLVDARVVGEPEADLAREEEVVLSAAGLLGPPTVERG